MGVHPPIGDDSESTRLQLRGRQPSREMASVDQHVIAELAAASSLLAAANPLLMMLKTLRTASAPGNVVDLRSRLIEMLTEFDAESTRRQIPELERGIASYALCAVIDECVQTTPWGGTANWAQQSLLIHFHRENWGGAKFFELLNRVANTPAKYQSLLELFYVCLALGFMGRFHLEGSVGRQSLSDLREKVYQLIRQARPEADRTLSVRWQGLAVAKRRFRGFAGIVATAGALAVLCLGIFAAYWWNLGGHFDQLGLDRLSVNKVLPREIAATPATKPRLAQLLAPEIAARQLEVRDLKLESIVTLLGENVFDSLSASPSAYAGPLIDKVAEALIQVEGTVLVTGHTDNIPTRTLRFASNWDLSKQRATNVARNLALRLNDPSRVTSEGRGDSEPVTDNNTPQGRSKNRRIEIVLKAPDAAQ